MVNPYEYVRFMEENLDDMIRLHADMMQHFSNRIRRFSREMQEEVPAYDSREDENLCEGIRLECESFAGRIQKYRDVLRQYEKRFTPEPDCPRYREPGKPAPGEPV